jgi:hypothetical protein
MRHLFTLWKNSTTYCDDICSDLDVHGDSRRDSSVIGSAVNASRNCPGWTGWAPVRALMTAFSASPGGCSLAGCFTARWLAGLGDCSPPRWLRSAAAVVHTVVPPALLCGTGRDGPGRSSSGTNSRGWCTSCAVLAAPGGRADRRARSTPCIAVCGRPAATIRRVVPAGACTAARLARGRTAAS